MSRFNSPEEVKAAAQKWAEQLYQLHIEKNHSLNPYCTPGARHDFDKGLHDLPRNSWDIAPEWDYRYQTGRALAAILEAKGIKP